MMICFIYSIPVDLQGKFDVYCKTERFYRKEKYITQIINNKLHRHITGIRCASNILPVNILRKCNIKRQYRFSNLCKSNEIGSELHVFMLCNNPEIMEYRTQLLKIICKQSPQLEKLQKEDQLSCILQGIDKNVTLSFAIFVDKIYKLIVKCKSDNTSQPI